MLPIVPDAMKVELLMPPLAVIVPIEPDPINDESNRLASSASRPAHRRIARFRSLLALRMTSLLSHGFGTPAGSVKDAPFRASSLPSSRRTTEPTAPLYPAHFRQVNANA
jgi:hypothetical protein